MVFEEIFKARWVERRPVYSLYLGVILTLISFFTSYLLFKRTPNFIGISTILFTVVLVGHIVNKLFDIEERIQVKEKLNFFLKHEHIIDFFVYFFIGSFIVLFVISIFNPVFVFSEKQLYDIKEEDNIKQSRQLPPPPSIKTNYEEIAVLFFSNLYVMIISFALSLFYGSGALFLITLNASIFASALSDVIKTNLPKATFFSVYSFTLCNLGIMFFHMVPEVLGYLLAAIAGGVLSHAIIREKFGSKNFKIVFIDSVILLSFAIVVLLIAAVIENNFSKSLFHNNICLEWQNFVIIIFILFILLVLAFEYIRKKKLFFFKQKNNS